MRAIAILLLAALASVSSAGEDDTRGRLKAELPRLAREATEGGERMVAALQRIGLAPTQSMAKAIAARRAELDEMEKLVADAARPLDAERAEHFREEQRGLRSRLGEIAGLAETLHGAARNWPRCAGTPELARYQALVRARLDVVMAELGGERERKEDQVYSRSRRRHETILGASEWGRAAAERWRRVPADTPVLRQFHEQRQALLTLAENSLGQGEWSDDRELERQESILSLLGERVGLVQSRRERLGDSELPADAPAVAALAACQAAEDEVLAALIALRRKPLADEAAQRKATEEQRQQRELCGRMTGIAWDWVGMAAQSLETQRRFAERLAEAPAALREEQAAARAKLDQERAAAERALAAALAARVRVDAARAKGELWTALRGYEQLNEDLGLRLRLATQEREFKTQAATATAALKRLAAARAAYLAARDQQRELEQAAIAARVARDLAEVASEEAAKAVEQGRGTVAALREELERVREAAEVEQAAQPPAASQPAADPGF